jgi:hypothetical protein
MLTEAEAERNAFEEQERMTLARCDVPGRVET